MKNREKFREELIKSARTPEDKLNVCKLIRTNVLPYFGAEDCVGVNCAWCKFLVDIWMDEECEEPEEPEEPEVDWDNVPVDTLVRVRDSEDEEWELKYFKGIDNEDPANRFMAWIDGATSKTAYEYYEKWTYCELVEDSSDK